MRRSYLRRRVRMRPMGRRGERDREEMEAVREAVFARAGYRCERCGRRGSLHPHHRLRRSQGGPNTLENLCSLCHACHRMVHDLVAPDWREWLWSRKEWHTRTESPSG